MIRELLALDPELWIIAPDLRGHGESSMPGMESADLGSPFEIMDFAQDILELMDQLEIVKVHLIGHSMGSMIAQQIALHHPQRLASLSLLGTTADPMHNGAITEFLEKELLFGSWKKQLKSSFGKDWREKSYWMASGELGGDNRTFLRKNWVVEDLAPSSLLEAIHRETIQVRLGTWFGALEGMLAVNNALELENLGTRTLVLWASGDGLFVSDPDQNVVKRALARASQKHGTISFYKTYHSIKEADGTIGHNFHWAIPRYVAADLYQFITQGRPELGSSTRVGSLPQIATQLERFGL